MFGSRTFRAGVSLAASLGIVTTAGAQPATPGARYAPRDGAPTRAACAALGFEIYKEPVNIYSRFPPPIQATMREDRQEYSGPPVIVPGAPPPCLLYTSPSPRD